MTPPHARERVPPLQGARNFRDLGGYAADGGRVVRWGHLFRSGALSGLTEADYGRLSALGVRVICDFRSRHERESEPTVWPGETAPTLHARDYEMTSVHMREAMVHPERTPETMRSAMRGFYGAMPYDHVDSYQRLFAEILAGNTPLIFNCSAGKDRTGVAAALVLTALGVGRHDILADYALSDQLVDYEALAVGSAASKPATGFSGLALLPAEIRGPMLKSDPSYLAATFEALETREGSTFGYLERHLGVGSREIDALRGALLQPA